MPKMINAPELQRVHPIREGAAGSVPAAPKCSSRISGLVHTGYRPSFVGLLRKPRSRLRRADRCFFRRPDGAKICQQQ
jgi:hypothetical protein